MGRHTATLLALVTLTSSAEAADKAQCLSSYEAAQRHKNAGELSAAKTDLLVCVEADCPALLRSDCETWLREVTASMASVVLVAPVPGARVLLDGKPFVNAVTEEPREVEPGAHTFRFEAPGREAVEKRITLAAGEKNRRVEADFPAPPPKREVPSGPPTISYVLAGVGAVGLLSFGYFGLSGLSGRSDLEDCKGSCAQDDVDDVQADFTRADVSLAVAAVALGGAAYFYFGSDSKKEQSGSARVGIAPTASGVSTAVHVSF